MMNIILQYVLIVVLVIAVGYFVYLLKDKNINIDDDYFSVAYTVLSTLGNNVSTEKGKEAIRSVSKAVSYVEANYRNEDNPIKEEKALELAKESLSALNLEPPINDDNIRYLIKLASSFLPPTKTE